LSIPVEIRALLVCPGCRGPLRDAEGGHGLDCVACGLRYPVRDGIPVMLVDQAEPIVPKAGR
jgi:uncharacterized protein